MAYTQADIDAIDRALAAGIKIARHGETTTEFRSTAEMLKLRALMDAEVNGNTKKNRRTVARFSRGF